MTTPNLALTLPTVGADSDTWGTTLNADLTLIDTRCAKIAFSAYLSTASQSLANSTPTKIALNGEEFDVGGFFDNATNYRFLPTVAGKYQFNWRAEAASINATGVILASLFKNGSIFKRGNALTSGAVSATMNPTGSALVDMNGSTDYVELWVNQVTGGSLNINGGDVTSTYLQGFLVFPT